MADNVSWTAGSGTTIATDDVSTVHYQRVKLTDGTADSTTAITGTSDGSLNVEARYDLVRISGTVPGTSTTAYAAGDQIGTIISFANAARVSGGNGYVVGAYIISALDVVGPMDLLLFRQSITLATDSSAFAISDSDALNFTGLVQLGAAWDIGNNRVLQAYNLRVPYVCTGSTTLYGALYARGSYTLAASDLVLDLFVERN